MSGSVTGGRDLDAVVFDWGDTLVRFPGYTTSYETHRACLEALHGELAAGLQHDCFARAGIDWLRFLGAYEAVCAAQLALSRETQREHRLQDRFRGALRRVGCACPLDEASVDRIALRFAELLLSRAHPMEGAQEVLAILSARYPLGVVANYPMPHVVLTSLDRFGLRSYLSTVVISGAVGWVKPSPHPFRQALRELGATPGRTLFVGDDLANDMRGAKAAGLTTAWLTQSGDAPPEPAVDYRLARLRDVLDIVRPS